MSQQPVWETEAGSLGVVPEGRFYSIELRAFDPDFPNDATQIEYTLLAGSLPEGVQVQRNGTLEGIPISIADFKGVPQEVSENTEARFTIRATSLSNRIADRTFSLVVSGQDEPEFVTPAGQVGEYYDGYPVDIQIEVEDVDSTDTLRIYLVSGELPPGVTISSTGRISGFIEPALPLDLNFSNYDNPLTGFDQYPWDFRSESISRNYEFTLGVTDGKNVTTRKFSIYVNSTDGLSADTTEITADNTFITADVIGTRIPYITNYTPDLGRITHDNFYAHEINANDPDSYELYYEVISGTLPPGLTLDQDSGWLYGYLPDVNLTEVEYNFFVQVYRRVETHIRSIVYEYTMTVVGEADRHVTWLTPEFLGYIDNGDFSTFYVAASYPGYTLQYRLKSGEFSRLPQGLKLLSSGNIVGRTSFKTFSLDGGTTTFDSEIGTRLEIDPTTFDLTFRITVEAYTSGGQVSAVKEFVMMVNREHNSPYNILYAKATPPQNDRDLIDDLVLDSDIMPPEYMFRLDDPNFGVARNVVYNHAYGLTPAALEDYFAAMSLNHYNKTITLGEIKTARALDDDGNIIYEVIYSRIIDNLVNPNGTSVGKVVDLSAHVVNLGPGNVLQATYDEVYPNSLHNMREQVVAEIGQVSKALPRWMLSKQEDGKILGFTPAWVIAYTKPGASNLVAYRIARKFGNQLNKIDFELDRFTLNSRLARNWDQNTESWLPGVMTTFDREASLSGITADNTFVTADSNREIHVASGGAVTADTELVTADSSRAVNDPNTFSIYATPRDLTPYQVPSETVFDGGGTRFISPISKFEDTDRYDQYVKFPQVKIVDNNANV